MSIRRTEQVYAHTGANQLRSDLETLRAVHLQNEAMSQTGSGDLSMNDLSETERSAASLGVEAEALKPIGFMNTAHYDRLLASNVLSGPLAQKIEAFRAVSDGSACPGC